MGKLVRFGVSLDEDLLEPFDDLCKSRGYASRSEAIRDLIRAALAESVWGAKGKCRGTLTLVYDHHKNDISRRLINLQHEDHDIIATTMHLHIDHNNCLEVLVLNGDCQRVLDLSQKLASCKGVKYGVFNHIPEGEDVV